MKKVFIGLTSLIVLVVAALVIIATVDFNRLGKDAVYVQITGDGDIEKFTASDGEVMMMYWYKQPAYKESGEAVDVKFSAGKNLRQDAYLKLYVKKGNEVTSYDEVSYEELPDKVKEQLVAPN
ncbi:YxeA family protein [Metasolibacillus sp.]|uniref:YxeA family protein n=1 Tax=Metasolibacillus sp. TaxID=2703680 RepID=UPI0025E0D6A5|nr:YxeA family protein [Metasolibacillus sp.]MCT6924493.1 YxeA family protein [Metasolibacillus sp.]MCT6940696.1 YxeA family protein [Metasolibacillus sp.]